MDVGLYRDFLDGGCWTHPVWRGGGPEARREALRQREINRLRDTDPSGGRDLLYICVFVPVCFRWPWVCTGMF